MEIDIERLKTAAEAAKLAAETAAMSAEKAATVASAASVNAAVVNVNIEYIKKEVTEIKETLKMQAINYVSHVDFTNHLKADEDHEHRIRVLEVFKETLIGKMWGIGVLVSLVGGIVSLLVSHFWK